MLDSDWPQAYEYIVDDGGHPPSFFSKAFAEGVPITPGETRFLDIGCGSGILGIYCLIRKKAAFVTFNDVLPELISVARGNVAKKVECKEIAETQVRFLEAAFAEIPFDIIFQHSLLGFNPPQLPDKYRDSVGTDTVTESFRNGGPDGLAVAREFFHWYAKLPSGKPNAAIQLSSFLGWSSILLALEEQELSWKVVCKRRVPLRAFMQDDAEKLSQDMRALGDRALMRDAGGRWTKELVMILLMDG